METFGQRLTRLMNSQKPKRATQKEIAELVGVAYQSVQRWQKDIAKPEMDKIKILSEHFDVSADYLMFGTQAEKGSEFTIRGAPLVYESDDDFTEEEKDELYFVDFAPSFAMACGDGQENYEPDQHIKFPFFLRSLRKAGVQDPSQTLIGYAEGESNAPTIPHGAAVGIDKGSTRIQNKETYLLTIDGGERLKQVINMGEGRIMLRSHNPDKDLYPDEILTTEEIIERQFVVRGRMFWCSWLKPVGKNN
jgi:repressor protein